MPRKCKSMLSLKAESSRSKKPKTDEEAALTVEPRDAAVGLQLDENPEEDGSRFIGEQVPDDEGRRRWPHRYTEKVHSSREYGCCSSFSGAQICPALAAQGLSGEEPVFALREKFPRLQTDSLPAVEDFV